jgi:hypothetical protein
MMILTIKSFEEKFIKKLITIVNKNTLLLVTYLRQQRMTGGTNDTQLAVRTGYLRRTTTAEKAVFNGNSVSSKVNFGAVYAHTHIGKKGELFRTIVPKHGQALAIPLAAALTKSGVAKGSPRDKSLWGNTFIKKSEKGNTIIFGQQTYAKGEKAGKLRSKIVPLFLLLRSVKIPVRIHTNEMADYIAPKLIQDLKNAQY